jgi:hypothetical protein
LDALGCDRAHRFASGQVVAKEIKVCLIAGKTGPLEAYAKQTEAGFMMGLEYLTKGTLRVGGDQISVLSKDDQLKPDRGKALLEECYGDDKADGMRKFGARIFYGDASRPEILDAAQMGKRAPSCWRSTTSRPRCARLSWCASAIRRCRSTPALATAVTRTS